MKNQPKLESEEVQPLTIAQMDALLKFLPIFTAEGFQAGVEGEIKQISEGVFSFPYWDYHDEVDRFNQALYKKGVIMDFDWPDWKEAQRYWENPEAVAEADPVTLRKLLIVLARRERFCDGHQAEMFRIGHVAAILKRIAELRAEQPKRARRKKQNE